MGAAGDPLWAAVGRVLGATVCGARPLAGGDINQAFAFTLEDGRTGFVKSNARPPRGMCAAEARVVGWLAAARALRVPQVLAVSEADSEPGDEEGLRFLVLEAIEPGRSRRDFDDRLGRGLAALHRAGAPGFGLDHDN